MKSTDQAELYFRLQSYIRECAAELDQIESDRKNQLTEVADYVAGCLAKGEPARLTFICTHNSRRSHMAQIWAATTAAYCGVDGVYTYSGGTEATAFNPRAVAALERAGFDIKTTTDDRNPVYHVCFGPDATPMTCFSKVYNQAPNPQAEFAAIMTCAQADRACPSVSGASKRFAIPYEDPKDYDGESHEAQSYDQRCRQIAREMLYLFSKVESRLTLK